MSFQFELSLPGEGKDPVLSLDDSRIMNKINELLGLELKIIRSKVFPAPSPQTIQRKKRAGLPSPGRGFYGTGDLVGTLHCEVGPGGVRLIGNGYAKYHRHFFGYLKGSVMRSIVGAMRAWERD